MIIRAIIKILVGTSVLSVSLAYKIDPHLTQELVAEILESKAREYHEQKKEHNHP